MKVYEAIQKKSQLIPAKSDSEFMSLINVICTDRTINTGATYTVLNAQETDLAVADIYGLMAQTPEINDGKFGISVDADAFRDGRRFLYYKWGIEMPELENRPVTTTAGNSISW